MILILMKILAWLVGRLRQKIVIVAHTGEHPCSAPTIMRFPAAKTGRPDGAGFWYLSAVKAQNTHNEKPSSLVLKLGHGKTSSLLSLDRTGPDVGIETKERKEDPFLLAGNTKK